MSGCGASSPKRLGGAFVFLVLAAGLASAAELAPVRAVEAIDGDTLRLADGRAVRLAAIQAPKAPATPNAGLEALAGRARDALAALAVDRPVTLTGATRAPDRHGRTVALVHDAAGRLLQAELLRAGFARVTGAADQRAQLGALYEAEAAARAERRGLWALGLYRVRRAEELAGERDGFQIVEGTVHAVEPRGRATALVLGAPPALTVLVPPAALRLFRAAGRPPETLVARPIRVRGWITHRGTPTLELAYPEQIELQ